MSKTCLKWKNRLRINWFLPLNKKGHILLRLDIDCHRGLLDPFYDNMAFGAFSGGSPVPFSHRSFFLTDNYNIICQGQSLSTYSSCAPKTVWLWFTLKQRFYFQGACAIPAFPMKTNVIRTLWNLWKINWLVHDIASVTDGSGGLGGHITHKSPGSLNDWKSVPSERAVIRGVRHRVYLLLWACCGTAWSYESCLHCFSHHRNCVRHTENCGYV